MPAMPKKPLKDCHQVNKVDSGPDDTSFGRHFCERGSCREEIVWVQTKDWSEKATLM